MTWAFASIPRWARVVDRAPSGASRAMLDGTGSQVAPRQRRERERTVGSQADVERKTRSARVRTSEAIARVVAAAAFHLQRPVGPQGRATSWNITNTSASRTLASHTENGTFSPLQPNAGETYCTR